MKKFRVWAPEKQRMILHVVSPFDKEYEMVKDEYGYYECEVENNNEPLRYFYKPDGENDFPDPASQYQPDGVHGASETVDHSQFEWDDDKWKGLSLSDTILYEVHVGTFTKEGTFDAVIDRLDDLYKTGINAIELMPVAQFPGTRNWGYDGVYPYAVQNSYGGPDGLKRLVNACHQKGIAVYLDVVYNHVGPEGNYFSQYGPYFTSKYSTPWGDAINYDGDWSDGVREYFSDNVIHWMKNYHIDGLRCDAIHAMYDIGAIHFWELVRTKIDSLQSKTGRLFHMIAESDLNSPKVVKHPQQGGFGFDAQWLDDFHHALYKMLNPQDAERYYDFGKIEHLAKALKEGFVHSGEWVKFRKRKHGTSSAHVKGDRFVAFNLNHDQAGNRAHGERLCMLVDDERVKIAAAALLLAPYVPMLFMGEEYADDTPFYYFVSHSDEELIKAVQEGRKAEFAEFGFDETVPDPQDEKTFADSVIDWSKRNEGKYGLIRQWHEALLRLRKITAAFRNFDKKDMQVVVISEQALMMLRSDESKSETACCLFNFSEEALSYRLPREIKNGSKVLDSRDNQWFIERLPGSQSAPSTIHSGDEITLPPLSVLVYLSR